MAANRGGFRKLGPERVRDLGFGETLARDARVRLLNRDGTFNAGRHGLALARSVPIYEHLTTVRWSTFYLVAFLFYLACITVFAFIYLALGPEALVGDVAQTPMGRFAESFFFSVHTVTTLGYGSLAPVTVAANLVAAVEALCGLAGFAVMAALLFARLSRPSADVRFSGSAVIGPYEDGTAFMFRIANGSRGELVEASVQVMFSWLTGEGEGRRREFVTLTLERDYITFFPMHWTVVHPIGPDSPLHGWDARRLEESQVEILVQVTATAETYSKIVRARSSYVADEVEWDSRYANILEILDGGRATIDVRRLGDLERHTA